MCVFLSTEACKPVLLVRQNENDEPENEQNTSPLICRVSMAAIL